jgi:hypothetical protein
VTALDQACKILGLYACNNRQKTDPLTDLPKNLSGKFVEATADNSALGPESNQDWAPQFKLRQERCSHGYTRFRYE